MSGPAPFKSCTFIRSREGRQHNWSTRGHLHGVRRFTRCECAPTQDAEMHNESVHLDEEIDALRTPQASSPFDNLLQQVMEWLQLVPPDPSLSTASSTASVADEWPGAFQELHIHRRGHAASRDGGRRTEWSVTRMHVCAERATDQRPGRPSVRNFFSLPAFQAGYWHCHRCHVINRRDEPTCHISYDSQSNRKQIQMYRVS